MTEDSREYRTYFDAWTTCASHDGKLPEPRSSQEFDAIKAAVLRNKSVANIFVGIRIVDGKTGYTDGTPYNLDYVRKDCPTCIFIIYNLNWQSRTPYAVEMFERPKFKVTPLCERKEKGGYSIVP